MTRLYEEVVTRLEEMAMIVGRTLKIDAGEGSTVLFSPLSEYRDVEFAAVEILSRGDHAGCYEYREGACFRVARQSVNFKSKEQ